MSDPAPPGPDVEFRFNQVQLADDAPDDFGESLVAALGTDGLTASVVVEPGSEDREPITAGVILLVVHFLHAQGVNLAVGTASGALWDGIKSAYGRLRRRDVPADVPVKVVAQYKNGPTIEIDLEDPERLPAVLRQLRDETGAAPAA